MIDAHLHLWDPGRLRYDWLSHVPPIAGRQGPEEWTRQKTGVTRAVFVQSDCEAVQALDEVDWIAGLAHPALDILGIVAFAPLELGAGVAPHLDALMARPRVRGVRRLLQGEPDGFIASTNHVAGLIETAGSGLTLDLCVVARQLPQVIEALDALYAAHPDARVVLDHLGKPDIATYGADITGAGWAENIDRLSTFPNLNAKISGLPTQDIWDAPRNDAMHAHIDHALERFGVSRLMFGGDWPVVELAGGYTAWLETVAPVFAGLSPDDRRAVEADTAIQFYGLEITTAPEATP